MKLSPFYPIMYPVLTLALAAAVFSSAHGGESTAVAAGAAFGEKHLYVGSHAYDVAIAPVDEQSKNAEEAVLYVRRAAGGEWERLGVCEKVVLPGGAVRFTRPVDVEEDGVYEYTSRPVVGGEVARPPVPGDMAQAVVVVDTLSPKAVILTPGDGAEVAPGERVELSWVVTDENLGDTPGVFTYSADGGKSWNLVERALRPEGATHWTAPADLAAPAIVRLAAIDLAGNVGRDVRSLEPAAPETAAAPVVPPSPPVVAQSGDGDSSGDPEQAEEAPRLRDPNRSWLYYLMAVNLMRQNKPSDALHYYWLAVREDPDFVNAWADIALAYIDLGAYRTARDVVTQARDLAPDRIDLFHLMGETYHAEGMSALGGARSPEERLQAKGLIDQAVLWYGRALDKAVKEWRQADQAASFYRLGEICYYVNMDKEGARAYWEKILTLHTPPPNSDLILWSPKSERAKEKKRQESYTHARVALEGWQKWANGYLQQMAARDRAGIVDLMPAQRVSRAGGAVSEGDRNRSLFSLPSHLGVGEGVAVSNDIGESGGGSGSPAYDPEQAALAAQMAQNPITDGYAFYADARREGGVSSVFVSPSRRRFGSVRRGSSAFSPMLEPQVPPPADPYAFPQGGRSDAPWNSGLPYGDVPVGSR